MRSTLLCAVIAALLVLVPTLPGRGAPAGGLVWNGEPAAVAEYQEAWTAWRAVNNYKSRVSAAGTPAPITWEWVRPNRVRISFTSPQPGSFIIIGTDRWATSPNGSCNKIPANVMPFRIPDQETPDTQAEGTITITRVGPQTIDGVATSVMDVVTVSGGKQGKKRVFLTPAPRQFKRWDVESDQGKATIDYLEFNTGLTITPPC